MGAALDILSLAGNDTVSASPSKIAAVPRKNAACPSQIAPTPDDESDAIMRFLADAIELAKVPAPWVKQVAPDGQHFFANRFTGFSTWTHPLEPALCDLARACRECLWLSEEDRVARISELDTYWQTDAKAIIMMWYRVEQAAGPDYYFNLKTGETIWEDPIAALLPEVYLKCASIELLKNEGYVALLLGECAPPEGYRRPGDTPWAQTLARRVLRMGCIELSEDGAETASELANPLNPWDLPLRLDAQEKAWAAAEKEGCCCQSVRSSPCSSRSTDIGSSASDEDFSDEEACLDSPRYDTDRERNSYCQSGRILLSADLADRADASPANSLASAASVHIDIFGDSDDEADDGSLADGEEAQDWLLDDSSFP